VNLSVIVCAHNPHPGRLARTFAGLRAQTLPAAQWECLLVDSASAPALAPAPDGLPALRVLREPRPGLSHARRRGLRESASALCVFADDDNVLAPDYLAHALRLAEAHPRVGAFGGRSAPEFETPPPDWTREFFPLLALRDLGARPIVTPAETPPRAYPLCAPIGAGMVLRREAAQVWLDAPDRGLTDRRCGELTSAGDNDIVLTLFAAGWDIAYFPDLVLTHLIPAGRLDAGYLARLNRGIQQSWQQVLAHHGISPWPPLGAAGAALRQAKAWFSYRGWSHPAGRIRWQGACGHFTGRISR
jgi:glycosyltransferase involved in cell wall biosynthesis